MVHHREVEHACILDRASHHFVILDAMTVICNYLSRVCPLYLSPYRPNYHRAAALGESYSITAEEPSCSAFDHDVVLERLPGLPARE